MAKKIEIVAEPRLEKYFSITSEALEKVKNNLNEEELERAKDFLDMAQRYYEDAKHFQKEGNYVNAFACLNYAHGWLDAGARAGFFLVKDSRLFTVDD
jgi:uncharacterized protein